MSESFKTYPFLALALDPVHVGTGGTNLGRVDNTIMRDPVTKIPIIPGSSLAGVMRAYTAMALGDSKYPRCAGVGGAFGGNDNSKGHCGENTCEVCTVFGSSKGNSGGFAGLAGFSDMQILFFPVATNYGPFWITSPMALKSFCNNDLSEIKALTGENVVVGNKSYESINLGWLNLPTAKMDDGIIDKYKTISKDKSITHVLENCGIVSDRLFSYIVNCNLDVRTSVAIDPETGAAKDKALFTSEAIPRGTVLFWELTCRNPKHFKIGNNEVSAVEDTKGVCCVVKKSFSYVEHLGIGGMSTKGFGRMRIINVEDCHSQEQATDTQEKK